MLAPLFCSVFYHGFLVLFRFLSRFVFQVWQRMGVHPPWPLRFSSDVWVLQQVRAIAVVVVVVAVVVMVVAVAVVVVEVLVTSFAMIMSTTPNEELVTRRLCSLILSQRCPH